MAPNFDLSDNELFSRMQLGDVSAFEEIYHRHWSLLLDTSFRRLHDLEQSKDIVQEIFVDFWNRRNTIKIENLQAYLRQAVMYQVYKYVSRVKHTTPIFELFDSVISINYSSDNKLRENELYNLFITWLECLPVKRKKIFRMYYLDEIPTKEIARQLKISQKTVQNQLGIATSDIEKKLMISIMLLSIVKEAVK